MTDNKLELVYEAIALKIDNLGEEKSELFLAKLSLLLANEIDDLSIVLKVIDDAALSLDLSLKEDR